MKAAAMLSIVLVAGVASTSVASAALKKPGDSAVSGNRKAAGEANRKMRKAAADLVKILRVNRGESRQFYGLFGDGEAAHKAYAAVLLQLKNACDFVEHAAPADLSRPRMATAFAVLSPTRGKSGASRLSILLLWLQLRPRVDGIAVYSHGKPRWLCRFPKVLTEYAVDTSRHQYLCFGFLRMATSSNGARPERGIKHWRSLPTRHPKSWNSDFTRRIRRSWQPMPRGTGLWAFLRRSASGSHTIEIALTRGKKVISDPVRIPIIIRAASAAPKPEAPQSHQPASHPRVRPTLPMMPAPKAPPWLRLQAEVYNHKHFHTPLDAPHWQRAEAINFIELVAIPMLLPRAEDNRYNLVGLYGRDTKFPAALVARLNETLGGARAAHQKIGPALSLGKHARAIGYLWRGVHLLQTAPHGSLRLPTLVDAYAQFPARGVAYISVSYLCSRRLSIKDFSVVLFRHGKPFATAAAEAGRVVRRQLPAFGFLTPGPVPGPYFQGFNVMRAMVAPTPALERSLSPGLAAALKKVPVDRRFVGFIRSRLGNSIRIGLILKGKLLKAAVRVPVTRFYNPSN